MRYMCWHDQHLIKVFYMKNCTYKLYLILIIYHISPINIDMGNFLLYSF